LKSSNFVLGLGLIIIGVLFLFQNFGYVEINFREIWPFFVILGGLGFWPFFLIILGIILLVRHQMAKSKETEV